MHRGSRGKPGGCYWHGLFRESAAVAGFYLVFLSFPLFFFNIPSYLVFSFCRFGLFLARFLLLVVSDSTRRARIELYDRRMGFTRWFEYLSLFFPFFSWYARKWVWMRDREATVVLLAHREASRILVDLSIWFLSMSICHRENFFFFFLIIERIVARGKKSTTS